MEEFLEWLKSTKATIDAILEKHERAESVEEELKRIKPLIRFYSETYSEIPEELHS